jgi:ABC-type molybdate transport system substrate-binding protein
MNKIAQKFLSVVKFNPSSGQIAKVNGSKQEKSSLNILISLGIIATSLGLTYYPLLITTKTITIVIGSELQEPFQEIEKKFEQANAHINLAIKIQGSQDIITNFLEQKNDFQVTILIPANEQLITELETKLKTQGQEDIFYNQPETIAKTLLVAIAWQERGKTLFPNGQFSWSKLENALEKRNWQELGGQKEWGSFDFLATDPLRSNSGQLTLSLWTKDELNDDDLSVNDINKSEVEKLFQLIKNNLYQPPRSTDILLQEFIARGPNDVDVATVYESIALYRWLQVQDSQAKNYHIYYPNPSIETKITAVIPRQNVSKAEAKVGRKFIEFLKQEPQQIILAQYGFRPIMDLDLKSLSHSPWTANIPGIEPNPSIQINSSPSQEVMDAIQDVWQLL